MALYKGHEKFNLLLLPPTLYFIPKEYLLFYTLGYLFGTFFLSPDLDLPQSVPSRRWKLLSFLWHPYRKVFKHRGLSHFPFLGTLSRLLYLLLLCLFLYFFLVGFTSLLGEGISEGILSYDLPKIFSLLSEKEEAFYFVLGIFISDLFHLILDLFW